ncbi:hypothetical protein GGF41_003674, partial [Coemansia sp. RSA 2531]
YRTRTQHRQPQCRREPPPALAPAPATALPAAPSRSRPHDARVLPHTPSGRPAATIALLHRGQ